MTLNRHGGEAGGFREDGAHWRATSLADGLGVTNFALALYALLLGPMVEIAALRETIVLFAAFIGTKFLNEGFARRRVLAAAGVLVGTVIAHAGGPS